MATATDADLILKLYDLRREEGLRKARQFVGGEFQPKTFEEFKEVAIAPGQGKHQENAYWRQVTSYWEMAASLVLHGSIDPGLFIDCNGEGLFVRARFQQFHTEYEQATGMKFMRHTAELVERYPAAKTRYDAVVARVQARAKS